MASARRCSVTGAPSTSGRWGVVAKRTRTCGYHRASQWGFRAGGLAKEAAVARCARSDQARQYVIRGVNYAATEGDARRVEVTRPRRADQELRVRSRRQRLDGGQQREEPDPEAQAE